MTWIPLLLTYCMHMLLPSKTPPMHLHQVEFRSSKHLGKTRQETVYQMRMSKQYRTLMTTQLTAPECHCLFTVSTRGSLEPPINNSKLNMKGNFDNFE